MECEDCQIILDELESIDDDAHRSGIQFVKTTDLDIAKQYGIKIIPALVYYENQVPSIYEGNYFLIHFIHLRACFHFQIIESPGCIVFSFKL